MKLRVEKPEVPFHVVLVNPEIPQNTGNVARLCAATGSMLHLVGRLGFSTDEKAVRRAGLDYWHLVDVREHADLEGCLEALDRARPPLLFTSNTDRSFADAPYRPGSILVFGSESEGLPREVVAAHPDGLWAIPTCGGSVRSLNLANAVAVVVYRALEATGALGKMTVEP